MGAPRGGYVLIPHSSLQSPEFKASSDSHKAAWIALYAYCDMQGTQGIIAGCSDWSLAKWRAAFGIEFDMNDDSELWGWDGQDLILFGYQASIDFRAAGATGGAKKAENARKNKERLGGSVGGSVGGYVATNQPTNQPIDQPTNRPPVIPRPKIAPDDTPEGTPLPDGKQTRMARPSIEETSEFMSTVGGNQDMAQDFQDFYESKGWKVGREPMKDWRAAARRWVRSNSGKPSKSNGYLKLMNGAPPPAHTLPISEIVKDEDHLQIWRSGTRLWRREMGYLEEVKS